MKSNYSTLSIGILCSLLLVSTFVDSIRANDDIIIPEEQFVDSVPYGNTAMDIEEEGNQQFAGIPLTRSQQIPVGHHGYYSNRMSAYNVQYDDYYNQDAENIENMAEDPLDSKATKRSDENISQTSNLDELITLSLKLKTSTLKPNSFADQVLPMLATLKVGKSENNSQRTRANVDLVCVIDHSGSMMEGDKMELAKNTFKYLLEYLEENDRLSIVIFDDRVMQLTPLLRMTDENKAKTLAAISTIQAEGGTDINRGLNRAFQILKARKFLNPVSSIFLLSDGLDGGAEQRVKSSLDKLGIDETFTLHTFGFGQDHDSKLMTDIADLKDGNFYFIEKLDMIDEAFVNCLGGLISAVAKDVEIKIKPVSSMVFPYANILKAYGGSPMWEQRGREYVTKIYQLMAGKQKDYVLELCLPKLADLITDNDRRVKVATMEVTMTDLEGKPLTKSIDLVVELLSETDKEDPGQGDKEVMINYYRVRGAEVISDATQFADNGNFDHAKKLLNNFKEELAFCSVKDEIFIVNLIKDIEQAMINIEPFMYEHGGKHSMYGNARAQYQQRSYFQTYNSYGSALQDEMINEVKAKKSIVS